MSRGVLDDCVTGPEMDFALIELESDLAAEHADESSEAVACMPAWSDSMCAERLGGFASSSWLFGGAAMALEAGATM